MCQRLLALLFVLVSPPLLAEIVELPGSAFKLSVEARAERADVWRLWQDVDNWRRFDERLEYSRLDPGQRFVSGATGVLKGRGAPATRFVLLNVEPGVAFDERLLLPLWQRITLKRYFEDSEPGTVRFTHEVHFEGGMGGLYQLLLGRAFRKDIALVMAEMKCLLEADPD